jgi:hypothetical protein
MWFDANRAAVHAGQDEAGVIDESRSPEGAGRATFPFIA